MSTEENSPVIAGLADHPVRSALLGLLAESGTLTATEAARRLGHSSGVCSFHLRQLARYGVVEEAPHAGGRVRPWQLRREPAGEGGDGDRGRSDGHRGAAARNGLLGDLARGLEDESYRRWLDRRAELPARWRHDEAFSDVVYLTPEELREVADAVRALVARYQRREWHPASRPPGAAPVALVTRLFPLLEGRAGERGEDGEAD
ncbi:winged helix-turn-helix domain-containing protein [Allostreptomyces psammosilenae]|uniref:Putative ArsR family transcriptional regulator n=1 Tax=Allostreptomyces psammosilenae TaxID=1892865 RepID=A0A852ZMF2_9ACTN|nr:helix-turn-helix domain-containing protein [Allostreptomyces psammosilenae]NYI03579.1 putative ArsR family transcriptional regulator [Allostreptomyces psammosilenae]